MDDLNLHLQILVKEACKYPKDSRQNRQAINSLLRSLLKSGRIWRPRAESYRNQDIYEEALQKTLVDLSSKTLSEQYDPDRGLFLHWFNRCLENKYRDEIKKVDRYQKRIQPVLQNHEISIDMIDNLVSPMDATLLTATWESFKQWIIEDPDNVLKDCHIRDNPKANCQLFAELNRIEGKKWQEIADTVGSPQGSLRSHWNRKCEPLLQKWLAENQKLFGEENNDR
jgi:DNA-directed RNA polymerase specialized sigma24 family protein